MAKKIAVIGAGASGLTATKCCLDEGLVPVCFERTKDIGGLWRYTEELDERKACVYRSTIINTSKEMMCFSDFPIPKEYPNFMHNTFVQKYFNLYADEFKLRKYMRFETEILHAKKSDNFAETGQWVLEVKDLVSGNVTTEVFDGIMVCTGHHADKNVPKFPDQDKFKGEIFHPHDYRDPSGYVGKRIIVVGIGNSGADLNVELSRVASQVYLSTRRGAWIINRVGPKGLPIDIAITKRSTNFYWGLMSADTLNTTAERDLTSFDHANYGLKPKHRLFSQHGTVCDDLPNCILSGKIIVKPNIERFTAHGVIFEDGTTADDIDVVVLATGYTFGFPFLDQDVIKVEKNKADLYKYVFPPHLEKPTLAVIGCVQPLGAINPIAEMHARWATMVFKGDKKLPSQQTMMADICNKREAMAQRYVESQRHTIQVDWIPCMDEVAEEVGCKPNLAKILLTDPALAYQMWFGPCVPYQYRLTGPKPWAGARQAIMTTMDRVFYPTKTREVPPDEPNRMNLKILFILVAAVAILMRLFL